MRRPISVARLGAITVLLVSALLAPAAATASTRSAAAGAPTAAKYAKAGPYVPGVTTLDLGDRKVEVWYPADRGSQRGKRHDVYNLRDWLPAAIRDKVPVETAPYETSSYRDVRASRKGPFPLVLFSHGYASFRDQSTFLTEHLASWGFVVAAPDHLERGLASVLGEVPANKKTDAEVLRATVDLLRAENARKGSRLHGEVRKGKIAVTGHSAGGFASIAFGAQPDVVTYVALSAGAGSGSDTGQTVSGLPKKPSMFVTGAADTIVPLTEVQPTFDAAPAPKRLVVLGNAGHLAMTDICLIGAGKGGVIAIADSLGIQIPASLRPLATDGCEAGRLPARSGFPVVDHYVTAQLRAAFHLDKKPVGLDDRTADRWNPNVVTVTYAHKP
ncbi:MAG: dienelactone hydrolase family protein [Acidimicrobiia bacterium]